MVPERLGRKEGSYQLCHIPLFTDCQPSQKRYQFMNHCNYCNLLRKEADPKPLPYIYLGPHSEPQAATLVQHPPLGICHI